METFLQVTCQLGGVVFWCPWELIFLSMGKRGQNDINQVAGALGFEARNSVQRIISRLQFRTIRSAETRREFSEWPILLRGNLLRLAAVSVDFFY